MATIASVKAGAASDAATWGGALPAAGDTVNVGHAVEVDVDWRDRELAAINVNAGGQLWASRTPGNYALKCAGNVTLNVADALVARGAGADDPYPAACTFTVFLTGASSRIDGRNIAGALDMRCQEPAIKVVRLTADAAIGETALSVDADVSTDPLWTGTARVDLVAKTGLPSSEERTIASVSGTTITLAAGLTVAKPAGSLVVLIRRNVAIIGNSGANQYGAYLVFGGYIGAEIRGCTNGLSTCTVSTLSGSVSGCTNGLGSCTVSTLSGTVSGCGTGLYYCIVSTVSGSVSGCTRGLYSCTVSALSGSVSGCANGLLSSSADLRGATLSGNQFNLRRSPRVTAWNTTWDITPTYEMNSAYFPPSLYIESLDHNKTPGAFQAYTTGGVVDRVSDIYPSGSDHSYRHTCSDASAPCYRQWTVEVAPGDALTIAAQLRKNISTALAPKIELIDAGSDPLAGDAGAVPLATAAMSDYVDTWETLSVSWCNPLPFVRRVIVRISAQDAAAVIHECAPFVPPVIKTPHNVYFRDPIGLKTISRDPVYQEPTYSTVTIPARVNWKTRLVRNIKGEQVVAAGSVLLPKAVTPTHETLIVIDGHDHSILSIERKAAFSQSHWEVWIS